MKLLIAGILAVVSAIPLSILVTRADKRRRQMEALGKQCAKNLVTREEFEAKKHEILNRSYWRS